LDSRLVAWTVVLAVSVGLAAVAAPAAVIVSLLGPMLALLWTWRYGLRAAGLAVLPGAVLLALLGPGGLPVYVASVMAGAIVATALRSGFSFGRAVALGSVPFAIWTTGLAVSGFDPVSPEFSASWSELVAGGGEELRDSAERAVEILRNTWVASEVLWFAGLLAVVGQVARRMRSGRDLPAPGPWSRLNLPDAVVGALIAGLVLILLGRGEAATAAGWNLIFGSGALYALRGVGIEIYWLDRGSVGRGMRALFFVVNVLLFLPVFVILSALVGLLDTWFDFRRLRGSEGGRHPLSLFHHSSGDDLKE